MMSIVFEKKKALECGGGGGGWVLRGGFCEFHVGLLIGDEFVGLERCEVGNECADKIEGPMCSGNFTLFLFINLCRQTYTK